MVCTHGEKRREEENNISRIIMQTVVLGREEEPGPDNDGRPTTTSGII